MTDNTSVNQQTQVTDAVVMPAKTIDMKYDAMADEERDLWKDSPYPSIAESKALWDMMPRQPRWMQTLLSIVPDSIKFPAFIALTPGEMALADRVTCKYEMFRPTDLASACVVMGLSGGFKGAALAPSIELMNVLEEDTRQELRLEAEYLARKEAEASQKKKKKDDDVVEYEPVFNVRFLPNDTTKNRHIECLRCGRTTYTCSAEISALYEAMKRPAYDRKSFFLLCFDRSLVGSQTKRGTGGVNDSQPCRWNYLCGANLTSLLKAYPESSLTTGDIFRLTLVCVPNTFGFQSEFYVGEYSQEQKQLIRHVGELMMKCEGQTVTPRLSHAIHAWHVSKEAELFAQKDFEGLMLLGRIPLITYRICQTIHIAWGIDALLKEEQKRGKEMEFWGIDASRFQEHRETVESALIIADYLLDTMRTFFGKRLKIRNQKELDYTSPSSLGQCQDFCDDLPDGVFDYDQLKATNWPHETIANIRIRISRLVKSGKVRKVRKEGRKCFFEKTGE